jgi:membrane protein involved in aromatic hydrocarbon degradation
MPKSTALRLCLALALLCGSSLCAQDINDLLLYSHNNPTSTARSVGAGGAMGAVGGDFSTLSTNPAGLGFYRSSELAGTLNAGWHIGTETYRKQTYATPSLTATLGGLALVLNFGKRAKQEGLIDLNFGIAYNQLANYDYAYTAKAVNEEHSYLDALTKEAQDLRLQPSTFDKNDVFSAYNWFMIAARKAYLIEPVNNAGKPWEGKPGEIFDHFRTVLEPGEVVEQEQINSTTGHLGEVDFSVAMNYSNRLFVGVTLGVQELYRSWLMEHKEKSVFSPSPASTLDHFVLQQRAKEEGMGVNLKVGTVLRVNDYIRFGLAFHTPTVLSVETSFRVQADAYFTSGTPPRCYFETPKGTNKYTFYEPFRAMGSLGIFLGSRGFLSADYIFSYTPLTRFADLSAYSDDNRVLQNDTKPTHEVRAGVEFLFLPFVFRAGCGYRTSPYSTKLYEPYGESWYASAGFGMAFDGFYFDVAYRHTYQKGEGVLYKYADIAATSERKTFEGMLLSTVGFRF